MQCTASEGVLSCQAEQACCSRGLASREDIAVLAKCIHRTWQARTGRVRS